jgi:hypothetical protein
MVKIQFIKLSEKYMGTKFKTPCDEKIMKFQRLIQDSSLVKTLLFKFLESSIFPSIQKQHCNCIVQYENKDNKAKRKKKKGVLKILTLQNKIVAKWGIAKNGRGNCRLVVY